MIWFPRLRQFQCRYIVYLPLLQQCTQWYTVFLCMYRYLIIVCDTKYFKLYIIYCVFILKFAIISTFLGYRVPPQHSHNLPEVQVWQTISFNQTHQRCLLTDSHVRFPEGTWSQRFRSPSIISFWVISGHNILQPRHRGLCELWVASMHDEWVVDGCFWCYLPRWV